MGKVLKEIEVTLDTLAEFLDDAGWDVAPAAPRLVFHTGAGVGFSMRPSSAGSSAALPACWTTS